MAYDTLNTRNVAIITTGVTLSFIGAVGLGVLGNNLADTSHERIGIACVRSGASWVQIPNVGSYECRR